MPAVTRKVQVIHLSKLDTLPGTHRSPADLDCEGATVIRLEDGTARVSVWIENVERTLAIRYSYALDAKGNYVLGSARYAGGHRSIIADTSEINTSTDLASTD